MSGDDRPRRRFLQGAGAALLAALTGCGGSRTVDTPTAGPSATSTVTPTETPPATATATPTETETVTTTPEPVVPYERTLTEDHPLYKWVFDPTDVPNWGGHGIGYGSYAAVQEHLTEFAGGVGGYYDHIFGELSEFIGIPPEQCKHYIVYPKDAAVQIYVGSFNQQQVVEALYQAGSEDMGTRGGYRLFSRYTDIRQFPFYQVVDDGVFLSIGGRDYTDRDRLFELVTGAGEGTVPRYLEQNDILRLAYAPLGDVDSIGASLWAPEEARNLEESIRGLRVWTKGFTWTDGQVQLKSPMVFGDSYDIDLDLLREDLQDYGPLQPYDWEITAEGQIAYITGTAPIQKWDNFGDGNPPATYNPPDEEEYIPAPDGTQWSFETDYEAQETTVTYERGPPIERINYVGVALNNGDLFAEESQFRSNYDPPLANGDSVTVETPPELAGEDVTISWLSTEPYYVFTAYTLPEP